MDKISDFNKRSPERIIVLLGERMQRLRLAAGWTQEELAERAGVSMSTLKLFERTGKISLQRLAKVAVTLNVDGELTSLFEEPRMVDSMEMVERMERKRAPRRQRKDREK